MDNTFRAYDINAALITIITTVDYRLDYRLDLYAARLPAYYSKWE
jgi:hypothetical protein